MRVLVNGLALTGTKTGVGHYLNELVQNLHKETSPGTIHVHQPSWIRQARALMPRRQSQVSVTGPAKSRPKSRLRSTLTHWAYEVGQFFHRWEFRRRARNGGFDLYHEPNYLPIECDLPTVVTVHDLSVVLHPEWHSADRVALHERKFHQGIARSHHVVTVSECIRQEVIRHLGLPADRVSRTYNGIRAGLKPMSREEVQQRRLKMGLPEQYLLYLGTIEPRKNVLTLLKAYCALPATVREKYPLLLVGSWGWNSADIHDYLHTHARHRGVQYLGYVADENLPVLYNAARALVFPTHYEGFGLPPVEMLACGGAVLASKAGAIVETVGRKACLIDATDIEGWRDAMERVCTDHDWWRELKRDAPEAVRAFSWQRCAQDTLRVYESIVMGKQPYRYAKAA